MAKIDFGKTAQDYAKHRQGFPPELFKRLSHFGIGKPKQTILDLGTGTGTLARGFALQGAKVTGLDPAKDLLEQAKQLDQEVGVDIQYIEAKAETTGLADHHFDVVTAGQCWHWFDPAKVTAEIRRLLKPAGKLVIARNDWISLPGSVPVLSETIMQKYAPTMTPGLSTGFYPEYAVFIQTAGFKEIETFSFDYEAIYTHEAWSGRIRASQWIGARLSPDKIAAFDAEHRQALVKAFPKEPLAILHRCFVIVATKE